MSILSHIKGAISGFAKGGYSGAIAGAIGGQNNAPPARKGGIPVPKAFSPISAAIPTTASFSSSGLVRLASTNSLAQLPTTIPSAPLPGGGGFGGSGATGSFGGQTMMPLWAYHRLYTKKGQPRRVKRDGTPYAAPRMNPMNVRAARRAVRRIRGARKLLQRIERSLPKQTVHRRRA